MLLLVVRFLSILSSLFFSHINIKSFLIFFCISIMFCKITTEMVISAKITFCNKMIDSCSFCDWNLRVKLSFRVKSDPGELRDGVKRNVGRDGPQGYRGMGMGSHCRRQQADKDGIAR